MYYNMYYNIYIHTAMKASLDKILKLGDPMLYEKSSEVSRAELALLKEKIDLLFDLIIEFRRVYGEGRGIAAPQIGVMKRIFCLIIDGRRHIIINPYLSNLSDERFEELDWCMSFPSLKVKVMRHQSCTMTYLDENWDEKSWHLEGDLSQLVQHEYDHLDGILATMRAVNNKAFIERT